MNVVAFHNVIYKWLVCLPARSFVHFDCLHIGTEMNGGKEKRNE